MGLFDFLKSGDSNNSKKPSIDFTDYKFLSDDHIRFENGRPINANNKGAWRGIRIKSSDNLTFYVTMYNMNGNHPVWGDNIQMAEKRMKFVDETNDKIILRGFGTDSMGASFADYGITLHKIDNEVKKITLHMHDRQIDIVYEISEQKEQSKSLDKKTDFENFKDFTAKWKKGMTINEKMAIAMQSDTINNEGVIAYKNGNIDKAIDFFEKALKIMPNNDDSLKNLKQCYFKTGNISKLNDIESKLHYLSFNDILNM